jgi:hypothetical protein
MSPIYIIEIQTSARGFNKRNLMTMLCHRFIAPFIAKPQGTKTLWIFGNENDADVVAILESFMQYVIPHFASVVVTLKKGDHQKVMLDSGMEWKATK